MQNVKWISYKQLKAAIATNGKQIVNELKLLPPLMYEFIEVFYSSCALSFIKNKTNNASINPFKMCINLEKLYCPANKVQIENAKKTQKTESRQRK